MGMAVTALTEDASAVVYNPASIAGRAGFDAQVGVSLVLPSIGFRSDATEATTQTLSRLSTPLNVAATLGFADWIAVGVGVFNPFGAGATWPGAWEGRGRALTSNLQTFAINPTVALRPVKALRFGGGVQIIRGTVELERGLNFIDSEGNVRLGGSAWGVGFNAGVHATVVEDVFTFGLTYRSSVPLRFGGRAHFSNIPLELQSRLADQPISAEVTLPNVITFGLGVLPTKRLKIGLDVNLVTWNSFRELFIDFENRDLDNPLPKRWREAVSVHLGAEYDATRNVQVRIGAVYDQGATPPETLTPDLPDASRVRACAGVGYRFDFGLNLDVGYQFVFLVPQPSTAPGFSGTYTGFAQVLGLNAGLRL
jgi:long-chain fatty acid transport protein